VIDVITIFMIFSGPLKPRYSVAESGRLRDVRRGCAEGVCGACSVLLTGNRSLPACC